MMNTDQETLSNDQSFSNGQHQVDSSPIMDPRLMKPVMRSFGDYLIDELYRNNLILNPYYVDLIKLKLNEYDQFNMRRFEEKDQFINQLKQNLVDLTEKRFRQLNESNGASVDPNSLNTNMKFVLGEKDNQITDLLKQLNDYEQEIERLKQTIKEQDDVILSHNNNIYELKNNHETVLKAKQESFRMMNDDMSRKQKLIDDLNSTIKNLKDKIESLEEQYSNSRADLEKRLNDKEIDLQTKIATFEANLREGRHFFEDVLEEKEKLIKEKTQELNHLKQKLNISIDDFKIETSNDSKSSNDLQKFDSENLKNIKSLYEHQIELLKVKIEMLEKTCQNYQKGIKEMNKSFGHQQQTDEMASIQSFKDLMQEMHKTNAQLETERIDLQVKSTKLKEELDQVRLEKENLNRKFLNADQLNQKLQAERGDVELNFKRQLDLKLNEINHLTNEFQTQKIDNERLRSENEILIQSVSEYEQLKLTHSQLTQHYEQLYNQASEIVNGNQILNDQVQQNGLQIQQLNQVIEDYQLKIDHLEHCNSELNTQKINLDMKLVAAENKLTEFESDLKELNMLRNSKLNIEKLSQVNKDLELELLEKNELIEQLNQAKDFLAENNSKLLTNNIRIQLFIESMGLDLSLLESNSTVNEYDSLRNEFKEAQFQLNEIKILNQQLEINQQNFKDLISSKELEIKSLLNQLNEMKIEMETLNSKIKIDASEQADFINDELIDLKRQHKLEITNLNKQYSEQISQYETNFNLIQTENESLNSQLEETKQNLKALQQKYQDSLNEKTTNVTSDELLNELNLVKAKYEETLQKQTSLEQLNLKLKAKLKQFVKEKQQSVNLLAEQKQQAVIPRQDVVTQSISIQTDPIEEKFQIEELNAENLILFGSKLATNDLYDYFSSKIDDLNNKMNLFLLNNEYKLQESNRELKQLKEKLKQNETQPIKENSIRKKVESTQTEPDFSTNKLEDTLNEKCFELKTTHDLLNQKLVDLEQALNKYNELSKEHESLKTKHDNLRAKTIALKEKLKKVDDTQHLLDDSKLKHKEEIEKLHKMYTDQLSQFEANFTTIQNENEILSSQLEEAKQTILNQQNLVKIDCATETDSDPILAQYELNLTNYQNEIEALNKELVEFNELKSKHEELIQKQSNLEKMNLKYKAKLKQTLKQQQPQQQQQQQQNLLLADERSACSTPTLSPSCHYDSHTETKITQTDLVDINELENLLTSYKEELQILNSHLEKSHLEISDLNEKIKQMETSNKDLISNYEAEIQQLKHHEVKIETANLVKSSDEDLAVKYETLKQQNLKLKVKVKQLLEKSKTDDSSPKKTTDENQSETSSLKTRINELEIENQGLKSQLTSLESQRLNEITNLENEINLKNNEINKLSQDLIGLREQDQSLNQLVKDYELKLDELNFNLSELKQENKKQMIENSDLKARLNETNEMSSFKLELEQLVQSYQVQITELNDRINELKQQNDSLFGCNQKLNDQLSRVDSLEKLIKDYESKIEQLNDELSELEKENEELANRSQSNSVTLPQIDQLNSEITNLKQQNDNLTGELSQKETLVKDYQFKIEQLNNELSELEKVNNDANSLFQLEQLNLEILNLKTKIEEYQAKMEQLNNEIAELRQLNENLTNDNQTLSDQLSKINNLEKLVKDYETKVDQLNGEISELEKENEELANKSETNLSNLTKIDQLTIELENLKKQNENDSQSLNVQLIESQSLIKTYEIKIEQLSYELSGLKKEKQEFVTQSQQNLIKLSQIDELNLEIENLKKQNEDLINGNQQQFTQIQQTDLQIKDYQTRVDQLNNEINELKQLNENLASGNQMLNDYYQSNMQQIQHLEKGIKDYELKVELLNRDLTQLKETNESELKDKESKINELTAEINNIKSRFNDEFSNQLSNGNSLNYSSTNSINSIVSTRSGVQLESQLKTCHKKCETVVEKLNLLKKQNETLNSKIKSFKSMI